MSTFKESTVALPQLPQFGFKAFVAEVSALLDALANPGRIIAEVEQMRALQVEARRIEATQPARAETLRRQAARLCAA